MPVSPFPSNTYVQWNKGITVFQIKNARLEITEQHRIRLYEVLNREYPFQPQNLVADFGVSDIRKLALTAGYIKFILNDGRKFQVAWNSAIPAPLLDLPTPEEKMAWAQSITEYPTLIDFREQFQKLGVKVVYTSFGKLFGLAFGGTILFVAILTVLFSFLD